MAKVIVRGFVKRDDPIYSIGLKSLRVLKPKRSSETSNGKAPRAVPAAAADAEKHPVSRSHGKALRGRKAAKAKTAKAPVAAK